MAEPEMVVEGRRRWRTVAEKRRIVEETLIAGASVSQVARQYGVNANQVFQWRRQYQVGDLSLPSEGSSKLLPVIVSDAAEAPEESTSEEPAKSSGGVIHIELPGRALVSIESGVDPALVNTVLARLMR
ncbi:IS66-like element accessory protein TnpA [Candidatus Binatus sp.]|uniref:IS66-like element accessory protein TnpA n=1 Tax=Candidatus Binatus sp. TaxID=2811406 RepID=UPI003CC5C99C